MSGIEIRSKVPGTEAWFDARATLNTRHAIRRALRLLQRCVEARYVAVWIQRSGCVLEFTAGDQARSRTWLARGRSGQGLALTPDLRPTVADIEVVEADGVSTTATTPQIRVRRLPNLGLIVIGAPVGGPAIVGAIDVAVQAIEAAVVEACS